MEKVGVSAPLGRRVWVMQFVYLAVSCLLVWLIVELPENNDWLTGTVARFYGQRQRLGGTTDRQSREREGYKTAYTYTTLIKQHVKPTDYFLIPPQRYLIRNAYKLGAADGYVWLYPSVLYYHLGKAVHLLDMTGPDTTWHWATHTFWVQNKQLVLLRLTAENRQAVFTEFRKYDPQFFAYTPEQARRYYYSQK
ncbi:hypothetical protein [Spirosoma agri]|uniref:Uncharacterized protein n=1 Tax=Spirosoma agri TaxID=1987381 RepID=A0A6M0IJ64_9BACT|nr:hypothetical protein [Spirosoma agri]NEU67862.1 hypothetical protein [Spirosoma agri]